MHFLSANSDEPQHWEKKPYGAADHPGESGKRDVLFAPRPTYGLPLAYKAAVIALDKTSIAALAAR